MGGVEEGEEDTAECGFAAGGVIPFLQGMYATSGAASTDGDGRNAQSQGDIGVGGTDTLLSSEG